MTAMTTPVAWRSERWRKLTRRDLATFDDSATAAVLAAMDRGGVGRISSKGHAILRSPNGRTMSVTPNSNRSKQVVEINLRKLFPVTDEAENGPGTTTEAKAAPVNNNNTQSEATTATTTEAKIPCTNKACGLTFVTQGALYSHVNKDHVVCDEPGCLLSWDTRRQMVSHRNIVHRGLAPRRLAKQKGKATDKRGRALVGVVSPDEPVKVARTTGDGEPVKVTRSKPKGKGFSTMDPERRRELASRGGKKRQENVRAAKAKEAEAKAALDTVAEESEQAWRDEALRDVHGWVTTERQEKDEQIAGLQRQLEAVRAELAEANAKLDRVRSAFRTGPSEV